MRWTASVAEFVNTDSSSGGLRIEFNGVFLSGPLGGTVLQAMILNLLHKYADASCTVNSLPAGLELYFSVIDDFTRSPNPSLVAGMTLAADQNSFPSFARIFQNIDGSGLVGNNIYATASIGDDRISHPVTIEWHLQRGNLVTNPPGNLKKDIACNWVPLNGDFRQWIVDVTIDSVNYPVATYYYPEVYASYLNQYSPFVLHQEQFGACNNHLDLNESAVAYYDFAVLQEGAVDWVPIPTWQVNYSYDGACSSAPSDLRHGIGTSVRNGKKVLISRAGHANDVDMKKCDTQTSPSFFTCSTPILFTGVDSPPVAGEVSISNVHVATTSTTATIGWDTSAAADGMLRYGTTPDYGSHSAASLTFTGTHSVAITGLQAGTFFYRIESIGLDGHLAAQDGSFVIPYPPTVTTNVATGVGQNGAMLNATVNPNGASTTVYFDYGPTTAYGSTVTYASALTGVSVLPVSQGISSLTCNTLYHFSARASNSGGSISGSDLTFMTSACPPPASFYTLTPCRVADTRNPAGPLGGPALAGGAGRTFAIANQCGIPAGATSVSVNVTITGPTAQGHLTFYPPGTSPPLVSTINFRAGQTRANNALLPLGLAGDFVVSCAGVGTVDFILDVNGYFR